MGYWEVLNKLPDVMGILGTKDSVLKIESADTPEVVPRFIFP